LVAAAAWLLSARLWAAEPPRHLAVTTQAYGGGGELTLNGRNEAFVDLREEHYGAGFSGELGLVGLERARSAAHLGGFVSVAVGLERRVLGLDCNDGQVCPTSAEGYAAAQLDVSYRLRMLELRGGALFSRSLGDHDRWQVGSLAFPDVWIRFGGRAQGWVELGVGAYDVPTLFRPGAFAGAGITGKNGFLIALHVGVNAGDGSFGHDVRQYGQRGDCAFQLALTRELSAGVGAALQAFGEISAEVGGNVTWRP
jgi:hypothetical protein